jgi:PEGA domain
VVLRPDTAPQSPPAAPPSTLPRPSTATTPPLFDFSPVPPAQPIQAARPPGTTPPVRPKAPSPLPSGPRAAPPVKPGVPRKRIPALIIAPIAAVLAGAIVIALATHNSNKRGIDVTARNGGVPVNIATIPPGATVSVAGGKVQTSCTGNCKLSLAPGTYQVSATLDGYEVASSSVTITAQHPAAISLTLLPQAPSVRLLTDLPAGTVEVDGQSPVPLQDGQLVLDRVAAGTHVVNVKGPKGDSSASFSLDIGENRQPAISGPVTARNMIAVLVASFGKQARVVTNAGPWKLAVNGQAQSDASPGGTDLTTFQPGVNEIVVGDGKDQRTLSDNFSAAPTLTAFLKTDINAGSLTVATGQDGVHVFVNGKEFGRLTQRGQVRLQTLGKVTVRVTKTGFLEPPPQTIEVKKGADARVQFDLKPAPQFGSLAIRNGAPGVEVWLDQKDAGAVGPDGTFNLGSVPPGEHTVELRREQYLPKRMQRSFVAGQTVDLSAADLGLTSANGTIRLTRNPPSATVNYKHGDEGESHEARGNQIELAPGTYAFSASAPGFAPATIRIQVAAGENREIEFTLARAAPATPPPPVAKGMTEFADVQSWTKDGDNWVHKGGGFLPYKLPPRGVFTFTVQLVKGGGVFRSGAIRWCVQYLDSKNYLLSEMDRKNFWTGVIQKGERYERVKAPHNLANQKAFTIQLDVEPDHLTQSLLVGNQWKVLDTFSEPGRDYTQGKFGFLIQGNDEIAISDFKFTPK